MRREHDGRDDDALVAAVGDRNHDALGEIYRRHSGSVWSIAKRVCRSATQAEEVCQAVFTDLWSHPERFDPAAGSLRSWLVARAHARAVRSARPRQASRQHGAEGATGETPPSADVEVAGHTRTLTTEGRRAIDRLPTAEREVLLLAYLGGHSSAEIARLLGTLEQTVKNHIRSGLLNLRRALEVEGVTT